MVTRRQINQLARRIAEEFRPERIILFGSYAYGKPTEDSDVDLLVVMRVRAEAIRTTAVEIHLFSHSVMNSAFALDVLVRTPRVLERRIGLGDFFLREILEKGQVLYESADARMGGKGARRLQRRSPRAARQKVSEL